jgi:hypothetical protein
MVAGNALFSKGRIPAFCRMPRGYRIVSAFAGTGKCADAWDVGGRFASPGIIRVHRYRELDHLVSNAQS